MKVNPGRALDLLVAEKALGWFWVRYAGRPEECCHGLLEAFLCPPEEWERLDHGKDGDRSRYMKDDGKYPRETSPSYGRLPRFSTEMAAAWGVALKARTFMLENRGPEGLGGWRCSYNGFLGVGETAEHAVCVAALAAAEAK